MMASIGSIYLIKTLEFINLSPLLLITCFLEESLSNKPTCINSWLFCLVWQVKVQNVNRLSLAASKSLLDAYVDVFEESKASLPMQAIQHSIKLVPGYQLPNQPLYHTTNMESVKVECQIQQWLEEGKVRPNSSPCGFPALIVPKNDKNEWRPHTNYRAVNKMMVKSHYPLPDIEFLYRLKGIYIS